MNNIVKTLWDKPYDILKRLITKKSYKKPGNKLSHYHMAPFICVFTTKNKVEKVSEHGFLFILFLLQ